MDAFHKHVNHGCLAIYTNIILLGVILTNPGLAMQEASRINEINDEALDQSLSQLNTNDPTLLVEEADKLKEAGRLEDALILYEKARLWYKEKNKEASSSYGYILYSLGLIHFDLGNYFLSERLFKEELDNSIYVYGSSHPNTATTLVSLGETYFAQQKLEDALSAYQRALKIREKTFAIDSKTIGEVLFHLGNLYLEIGDYESAISAYLREITIIEKHYGPFDTALSPTLNNLAYAYTEYSHFDKAKATYKRSLELKKRSPEKDYPDIALGLNNLAGINLELENYKQAEEQFMESLAIREKILGADHLDTANTLHNLGSLYENSSRPLKAEEAYLRALRIRESELGVAHPETGKTYSSLGLFYLESDRFEEAKMLINKAYEIDKNFYGNKSIQAADNLNNLGYLNDLKGNYYIAEKFYLQALDIFKRHYPDDHTDIATLLNNLGSIALDRGLNEKAKSLFIQSLSIVEKVLGPKHSQTAVSLSNLAAVYRSMDMHSKAEPLYVRALSIIQDNHGDDHYFVPTILGNLAGVYEDLGLYHKARPMYFRALDLNRQDYGDQHHLTAISLNNIGRFYMRTRQSKLAEKYLLKGVQILREILGSSHRTTIGNLTNLAWNYDDQGRIDEFSDLLNEIIKSDLLFVQQEAPLMLRSERENLILDIDLGLYDRIFDLSLNSRKWLDLALFYRLNRQGLLEELEKRQSLAASLSQDDDELLDELKTLTSKLSSLSLTPSERSDLRTERDVIEANLYQSLPSLKSRLVQIDEVVKALPLNSVLIEFQKYNPYTNPLKAESRSANSRYLAMLLSSEGTETVIDLGPAENIDQSIKQALSSIESRSIDSMQSLANINELIVKPLSPAVKGYGTWIVSPDSEINRVPFSALHIDGTQRFLSEDIDIRMVTTGRELLRSDDIDHKGIKAPLILADPEYGLTIETSLNDYSPNAETDPAVLRSSALPNRLVWDRLKATSEEGLAVEDLIGGQLLMREFATADAVKGYGASKILHLATHAFYLPNITRQANNDPLIKSQGAGRRGSVSVNNLRGESPLLRSGIALAGANQPSANPNDDGYLTALEVAQLDWEGMELVVISACESGRGDIQSGEGVYGLKRAIAVAGAKSSLLSLWKVDDAATAAFMESFYKRLKDGEGRGNALASTQAEFRDHPIPLWREPYVWAAFQLSGDWGPMKFH